MTLEETTQLLEIIASLDQRNLTSLSVSAWHGVIGHLDFVDAAAAARTHYRTSTDWLLPAHVVRIIAVERNSPPRSAWDVGPRDPNQSEVNRVGAAKCRAAFAAVRARRAPSTPAPLLPAFAGVVSGDDDNPFGPQEGTK